MILNTGYELPRIRALFYVPELLVGFRSHGKAISMVNRNSRKFRMHLDELVCHHEFLFDPLYRPFRSYASQCRPPLNLNQWFAVRVKEAYRIARQASKNRSNPDPSLLEDMAEITQLFPGFTIVKKKPFSRSLENISGKFKTVFRIT